MDESASDSMGLNPFGWRTSLTRRELAGAVSDRGVLVPIAWGLVTSPPKGFKAHALSQGWALPLAMLVLLLAFALRRWPITLALVGAGALAMIVLAGDKVAFGPSAISLPHLDSGVFWTAF